MMKGAGPRADPQRRLQSGQAKDLFLPTAAHGHKHAGEQRDGRGPTTNFAWHLLTARQKQGELSTAEEDMNH